MKNILYFLPVIILILIFGGNERYFKLLVFFSGTAFIGVFVLLGKIEELENSGHYLWTQIYKIKKKVAIDDEE